MSLVPLYFLIRPETLSDLNQIHAQLNQDAKQSQAKELGRVLSDLACEVIEQVFLELLRLSRSQPQAASDVVDQSGTIIENIFNHIRKFMPYAICLLSNPRLTPMVNYLKQCIDEDQPQAWIRFSISNDLYQQYKLHEAQMLAGDEQALLRLFKNLIEIIDQGVEQLIIEPKRMLKFNFVVNKTLDGVIQLCTRMGYQRLEKVATELTPEQAQSYIAHFKQFFNK